MGSVDGLDNSDFEETDIPSEFELPAQNSIDNAEREIAKKWVLAKSMDANVDQILPTDASGNFEGSLFGRDMCMISGYPIGSQSVEVGSRKANSDAYGAVKNMADSDQNAAGILSFVS